MIKFFRKIRYDLMEKNKTGKYLKYAIGEIVLVVIGILIALQINNKNESYKAGIIESALLEIFIQDLQSDSISFSNNFRTLSDINSLHQKLYEIGVNNRKDIKIEKPNNIRRTPFFNPIAQENNPSIAQEITNVTIRKELLNYFKSLKDLNFAYVEFDGFIRDNMRAYLRKGEIHDLSGFLENQNINPHEGVSQDFIKKDKLILISKLPEFQQLLLEASIKSIETTTLLETVIDQNKKLMNTIQRELNK